MKQLHAKKVRAVLATGLALALPTLVVEPGSARAAAVVSIGDCAVAYPVSELTVGQQVTGKTVTQGVTPSSFAGEVLGVLRDAGPTPGVDIVIARLDSAEIQRVGGIWQGMSGSPVYAADGRLIGAVAYGYAGGSSPVAGIMPFSEMQTVLNRTMPSTLKVDDAAVRMMVRRNGTARHLANSHLSQMQAPLAVAGVPTSVLDRMPDLPGSPTVAYAAGSAPAALAPTAADMVAGGNLAATLSHGDITIAAIGTITSMCNGLVRGFGHALNGVGKATYGMAGAEAVYVQESPLFPAYKQANIGPPLGTITNDRLVGVSGELGLVSSGTKVTNVLKYGTAQRTSQTVVTDRASVPLIAWGALAVNHARLLGSYAAGAEAQTWRITGRNGSVPFTLTGGNRYADRADIDLKAAYDLSFLVGAVVNVPGVTVDAVSVDADLTDDPTPYLLVAVEQRAAGAWVRLDKDTPAHVKAGKRLRLRLVLGYSTGQKTVPLTFRVPKQAAGQHGRLVLGRESDFPIGEREGDVPGTLPGIQKMLRGMVHNDQVEAQLTWVTPAGFIERTKRSTPVDKVITTSTRHIRVVVG
jgi:SpoIVB peptidase S55